MRILTPSFTCPSATNTFISSMVAKLTPYVAKDGSPFTILKLDRVSVWLRPDELEILRQLFATLPCPDMPSDDK